MISVNQLLPAKSQFLPDSLFKPADSSDLIKRVNSQFIKERFGSQDLDAKKDQQEDKRSSNLLSASLHSS